MDENLKKYIDELISEIQNELDEATATGNVAGYNVPGAFSNGGSKDKNRKKKIATQFGMKIVGKMDESFMSDLDIIKKGSKDITDFVKKVLSDKQYKEVRTDKDFHKYLKSFYNESVVTEGKDEVTPKQLANLQRDIKKINPKIKVYISNHPVTKGKLQIELGQDHPSNQGDDREITKINTLLKKHTGDWRTGTMFTESNVNEGPMDRIFGGIPYTKKGKQSMVTMKLPDDVKERIIQRAKKEGKVAKPNNGGGVTVFESINEAKVQRPVNRWLELKNDETMHPHKKMAMGLKELKYQLGETQKFFNWYNKIKTMNELDSSDYWKRTQSHIYKIKERLVNIARTIKEIEK